MTQTDQSPGLDGARPPGGVPGDGADTAADALAGVTRRTAAGTMDMVQHGLRALTDFNRPAVEILHDHSRRATDAAAEISGACHKAAESTASDMHALMAAYMRLGCGLQEMQHSYLELTRRSMESMIGSQQALLGSRSTAEFARAQHDMVRTMIGLTVQAGAEMLRIRTRAAQDAAESLQARVAQQRP